MMTVHLVSAQELDHGRALIASVTDSGKLGQAEIAVLREYFADAGCVTCEEAEALFELDRRAGSRDQSWTAFFVETITSYVVWQMRPTGVVNEAQGEWLIRKVDQTRTLNALAALVNVMAEAHRVPLWFRAAVRSRATRDWPGAAEALAAADAEAAVHAAA
jgi:hypothetical protein